MNTTIFRFKTAAAIAIVLLATNSLKAATLFENFDSPGSTVKSFTGGGANITYPSGGWYMYVNAMVSDADRYNGTGGVRIRGYANSPYTTMMFDKTGGAGVVSFNYGSYSSNSGGEFIIQKSINQGSSWVDVGTKVTVPTWNGTFHTYSVVVNEPANVRFRISMTITSNSNTMVNIDDFQITDYNAEQTAIPISSSPTGLYETPQIVTLSSATPGATIYYTIDGTQPTTSSPVYSTPLNVTTTTKIRAIALAAGKVDSREQVQIINFPIAVNSIAEFYSYMPTSGTNPQYYKYTGEAIISYGYWASSISTAKKIVLQDNSAGIIIEDNYKFLLSTYTIGDKVTGFIGQINNTNDAPILYPYADFTIVSNSNSIDAKAITLANVPANTYRLVQLNDLYFDAADGTVKFGVNSFRVIHDASTPTTTSIVYNTPSVIAVNPNYIGTVLPVKTNLIALVMRNNSLNSGINNNNPYYYIFPRMLTEIDVPFKPITGLSLPKTFNLSTSGTTVFFETVTPEAVKVFSVSGQAVKSIVSVVGKNSLELSKGVYIIRIGDKTVKVLL
jgi:hypothetical protein